MKISKSDLKDILTDLVKDDLTSIPALWNIWFYFSDELPVEVIPEIHEIHGKPRFHVLYDPTNGSPIYPPKQQTDMTPCATWRPAEFDFGPHRQLIVGYPIYRNQNTFPICIMALLTQTHKEPPLRELLVEMETDVYVKCLHLWQDNGIPGITLFKLFGTYKQNIHKQDVIQKIRQFLRIDDEPQWGHHYDEYRESSGFSDGELIIVTNPISNRSMPGVIIGDLAVTGYEGTHYRYPNILFLQLVKHQKPDDSDKNRLHIPADIEYNGDPQSIAIFGFRFASSKYVKKWRGGEKKLDSQILKKIRYALGVYFERSI